MTALKNLTKNQFLTLSINDLKLLDISEPISSNHTSVLISGETFPVVYNVYGVNYPYYAIIAGETYPCTHIITGVNFSQ